MRALINPDKYTSPFSFGEESTKIFEKLWIFACMLEDVDQSSHYGFRICSKELLIQLDQNHKPKAFLNSCSHRGSLLCEEGKQSGRVRCPYHGWVYDKNGIPVGIPNKECFPEVVNDPTAFKLKEINCSVVGKFIFICFEKNPMSLTQYLGIEYKFLESISLGLKDVLLEHKKPVQANWKVVIENSLEGYHVPMVHEETFIVADGMSKSSEDITMNFDSKYHSSMNNQANPEWLRRFENKVSNKIGQWPYKTNYYTHHHIFPNLTVTSFLGYSFHVQNFKPMSHDQTQVHSKIYGTTFENQSDVGKKIIEKIYEDSNKFTLKVFDEDTFICDKVQRGLKQAKGNLVLGERIERRVLHFEKAYQEFI